MTQDKMAKRQKMLMEIKQLSNNEHCRIKETFGLSAKLYRRMGIVSRPTFCRAISRL